MQAKKSEPERRLYCALSHIISKSVPAAVQPVGPGRRPRTARLARRGIRKGTANLRTLPSLACRDVDVRRGTIIRPAPENPSRPGSRGRRARERARLGEPCRVPGRARDARRRAAAGSPAGEAPAPSRPAPSRRRHSTLRAPRPTRRGSSSPGCGAPPSAGGVSSVVG